MTHADPLLYFEGLEMQTWQALDPQQQAALADWVHRPWTRRERDSWQERLREALRWGEDGLRAFGSASGLSGGGISPMSGR